jgi:hypothetical protein
MGLFMHHFPIRQGEAVMTKYGAESFSAFWLVLSGCGSAAPAAALPDVGMGYSVGFDVSAGSASNGSADHSSGSCLPSSPSRER